MEALLRRSSWRKAASSRALPLLLFCSSAPAVDSSSHTACGRAGVRAVGGGWRHGGPGRGGLAHRGTPGCFLPFLLPSTNTSSPLLQPRSRPAATPPCPPLTSTLSSGGSLSAPPSRSARMSSMMRSLTCALLNSSAMRRMLPQQALLGAPLRVGPLLRRQALQLLRRRQRGHAGREARRAARHQA